MYKHEAAIATQQGAVNKLHAVLPGVQRFGSALEGTSATHAAARARHQSFGLVQCTRGDLSGKGGECYGTRE